MKFLNLIIVLLIFNKICNNFNNINYNIVKEELYFDYYSKNTKFDKLLIKAKLKKSLNTNANININKLDTNINSNILFILVLSCFIFIIAFFLIYINLKHYYIKRKLKLKYLSYFKNYSINNIKKSTNNYKIYYKNNQYINQNTNYFKDIIFLHNIKSFYINKIKELNSIHIN